MNLKTDWSEHLATMPAKMVKLKELLNDGKKVQAKLLISEIEKDLANVKQWIGPCYLPGILEAQKRENQVLVPTTKLRLLRCRGKMSFDSHISLDVLQQWFEDKSSPNAEGICLNGEWKDVPIQHE